MIVSAKGLITLLVYCSKGKLRISLGKQIATHYLQLKFVLLAYDVTVFVQILLWNGRFIYVLFKKKREKNRRVQQNAGPGLLATPSAYEW